MRTQILFLLACAACLLASGCISYHSGCRCKCAHGDHCAVTTDHRSHSFQPPAMRSPQHPIPIAPGMWTSLEPAAPDSVEGQLRAGGKQWEKAPGNIVKGAYVQDIFEGRLHQPKGRGAIGKVVSVETPEDGTPCAVVDFGRGYSVPIKLSELALVRVVEKQR